MKYPNPNSPLRRFHRIAGTEVGKRYKWFAKREKMRAVFEQFFNLRDESVKTDRPDIWDKIPPDKRPTPQTNMFAKHNFYLVPTEALSDDTVLFVGPPDEHGNIVPERCGKITGLK